MKKWSLALVLAMALLTACGVKTEEAAVPVVETEFEVTTQVEEAAPVEEVEMVAEEAPVATLLEPGQVELGGFVLSVGDAVTAEMETAFGTPVDTMEAPSCHFDGMDTLYFYQDFSLYTYMDGNDSVIYLIELVGEAASTAEGAAVGMSRDDVVATMGDDFVEEGTLLSYYQGKTCVSFSFDDGDVVSLIELLEA